MMKRINYLWLVLLLGILSLGVGIKGCIVWEKVEIEDEVGSSGDLREPADLSAAPVSAYRIDVRWVDNSNNEDGFRVERSDDRGSTYFQIGQADENEVIYYDESIATPDEYWYRICSFNLTGNSPYALRVGGLSNTERAISATNTSPTAPSALTGTAQSYTQIDLVWQDDSTNETGFKVERSTDGVNYTLLKAILTDDPAYRTSPTAITATYTDAGLLPTTAYNYRVKSYSTGLGDSAPSSAISITTLSVTDLAKTWGGSSNEKGTNMLVGSDASIYICGYTSSFGAGSKDSLLLKYDSGGKVLMQKTWGQSADDEATGLALDTDKNIYISGRTYNFSTREGAVFLNKYNPLGQLQFQRVWDGNNSENAYSMARTTTGLYIAGDTLSYGAGQTDMLILKYSEEGSLVWTRTWGTTMAETAYAVAADGSGYIYVAGETTSVSSSDVAIISMDANANLRWRRMWIDNNNERARAIAVSATGDVYVAGETDSSGAGSYDVVLFRYNSSGGLQWVRRWGGYRDDKAYGVAIDSTTGNVYICGTTDSFSSGTINKALFLIAYNSLGEIQSQQIWDGLVNDEGYQVVTDQYSVFTCGNTSNKASEGAWTNISGTTSDTFVYARTLNDARVGGTISSPTATLAGPIINAIDGSPTGSETGAGQDDTLLLRTRK